MDKKRQQQAYENYVKQKTPVQDVYKRQDNIQIDNETFLKVFRKVLKIVRQMVEDGIEHPSYFEFLFGMGMTAFAETDVEYIIPVSYTHLIHRQTGVL